jgi:hypothetical protein
MALSDPQSIKIDGVTKSLPRVSVKGFESEYFSEDGLWRLKVATTQGRRKRQTIRVDLIKTTTNPNDTTQTMEVSSSMYIVVDRPPAGWTNEEMLKAVKGFLELLGASENSIVKKMLNSES